MERNETQSSSSSQSRPQFPPQAASLIQSAARSMLDDATIDSSYSEDGIDNCSSAEDIGTFSMRNNNERLPQLSSLQHIEERPAIPEEQDRRRFIGCLAAILASSYDYDEEEDATYPGIAQDSDVSYLNYTEELYDDDDDDDEAYGSMGSDMNTTTGSNQLKSIPSLDSLEAKNSTTNIHEFNRQSSVSEQRKYLGKKQRAILSAKRHRRRRYDVLCKLLVSSSELLLLDKSVAKAFLPMLSRVLVPETSRSPSDTIRTQRQSSPTEEKKQQEPPPLHKHPSNMSEGTNPMPTVVADASITERVDKDDVLRPFLESLSPGAGFRCLSLLILQHLLTSEVGYDARIRHVLKKVGVIVLMHDMELDPMELELLPGKGKKSKDYEKLAMVHATRKFESLEHSIARRLIRLSSEANKERGNSSKAVAKGITDTGQHYKDSARERIVRGVKIGSAGIVAGTLFALTGGLAAPGIAAGVAAVAGSTAAATAAVVTLTSTAVVTTIFGVGGGSLAAYKMQRRTQGLTEFVIQKETHASRTNSQQSDIEAELFSTICISGWLRDKFDFQRPWGLHPKSPRLTDRLELLERFYSIYSPDHIPKCQKILNSWDGEERQLWAVLNEKYGCNPDHLFPLEEGSRTRGTLTLEQEEVLDHIFVDLGYNSAAPKQQNPTEDQATPFERMRAEWGSKEQRSFPIPNPKDTQGTLRHYDSMNGPAISQRKLDKSKSEHTLNQDEEYEPPEHLATVWDYTTTYGGELYTVRWESELLKTICDCVVDLAVDVVNGATRQILKQTVLSTFLHAVIWPTYLLNLANMIDGEWTLAVERADEAGRELAKTLLYSRAGRRPVVLIGFSFGARVIYSCLKELSRIQEEWEDYQELLLKEDEMDNHRLSKMRKEFDGMREPGGVVEDAIMMGLPNHLSLSSWKSCRQVVAGRLVNCFSTNDMILSLMFQAKRSSFSNFTTSKGVGSLLKPVCGTCAVPVYGVENIDISDIVNGHQDYCLVTGKILERVRHGQPLKHISATTDASSTDIPLYKSRSI